MTNAELDLLKRELSFCSNYLEFGSGNSTLLAVGYPNIRLITTVESDKNFMQELLKKTVLHEDLIQKKINVLNVDIGPTMKWGYPADRSYKNLWPDYSNTPFKNSEDYDLVLVDGRFRVACILQACLHLPADTKIMVHDFYNRQQYHIILLFLDEVEYTDTLGLFSIKKNNDFDRLKKYADRYKYIPF